MTYREEKDSMGMVRVPKNAYYGPQTQRAADNFSTTGLKLPAFFIHHLALVKKMAARVNAELGLVDNEIANAITQATDEVMDGRHDDQFVVDLFQTGSGTSTNMNLNEVLASRANEILTGQRGGKSPVHPNDHVNLGQSSNDVIPTAIHLSAAIMITTKLLPGLYHLQRALQKKAEEFASVKKIGRTHLQDAVPITLGDEFSAYGHQITLSTKRVEQVLPQLYELALGGTAVGNGINTHPTFASKVIALLNAHTGLPFSEAKNHFEAQAAKDAAVEVSGSIKTVAVSLIKIAGDIRWLGSGPRCGIGEINLPALQPGSSIMPGKVNPVIPEAVIQIAYQVMGNDTAIMLGGQSGRFELNVTMPLIAYNLLQSIDLMAHAANLIVGKCIMGMTANRDNCENNIEKSLALATALVPDLGYDRAAEIAKTAFDTGRTIRETVMDMNALPKEKIDALLDIEKI